MKTRITLVIALITIWCTNAQNVNIPDANFKSALLAHGRTIEGTNISNIDINFDNEIQVSEAEAYKGRIYVVTKNIENLTGIEAFINATELNCVNNQLTSLDISKNTALTTLYCYNNQITNLNISKNTALTKLYCYNNKLTNLDTSKNIALTELYCGSNKLQSLDTSKNIALTILNCGRNKLQSLDTSKNIALTSLNCLTAELVDLDVSKNTALEFLGCYNNKLTNLDISKNTKLTGLSCGLNLLTNLDVSKNTALIRLICSNNKLTNLDVSKNTNLVDLIPSVNPITNLDISNNTELNNLICRNNELTNLDISKNTKLKRLDCSYNKLTSLDLSKNLELNDLSFFYNKVTTLDISKNKMLIKLDCSNNELTQLNVANGKNKDFTLFDAKFNSELKCIQHDTGFNPETSNYEWKRDLDANWSDNCQGTTFWNKSFRSDPDWTKADNWTNGVPNKNLVAIIPAGVRSHPIIKSDLSNTPISNLTIERNTRLTIDPSGSLVADAVNLVNNGSVIINSNSTNNGTFEATSVTGNNIIYNRYATNKWHLIGAPVGGQDIDAFVANVSNALAVNSTTNARAFATYDNTQAQASNYWQYYQTATNPGAMVNAKGYAVKRQNAVGAGTLKFKGTYNAGNVTYTGTGSAKNKFEMISNPYTRYLNLSAFLTSNANNMNPTNTALYFWNDTQNRYDVYNSSSTGNGFIAPGQGFFAELASTNGSFTFQPNMTTHNAMRALLRTEPQTAVTVSISEGKSKKTTQIKYLTNTGKGLDVGYDAGYFDGNQSNVGIYTKLADGTYNNTNFMLQCVGKDTAEATVIPLGIKTDAERTVTFTAKAMHLPENLKVFLEDTKTGSVTELNNGGAYKATVNAGSGRFFLHTKASAVLSTKSLALTGVTIFKQGNNLQVKGVEDTSKVVLYNLQGKEVVNAKITSSKSLVALPQLATGMYVVTVSNKKGSISKKIIF